MTSRTTVVLPLMQIDANPGEIACKICVDEGIGELQWSDEHPFDWWGRHSQGLAQNGDPDHQSGGYLTGNRRLIITT